MTKIDEECNSKDKTNPHRKRGITDIQRTQKNVKQIKPKQEKGES